MKRVHKTWLAASFLIAWSGSSAFAQTATLPTAAPAEPAAPTQTSTSPLMQNLRENLKASYTMWITGPTVANIDGKEGNGNAMNLDQFAKVGYKVSKKWTVSATQPWTNLVRSDSEGKRNLTFQNPYITASNSSFTKSDKYGTNLGGLIRYYMPFAHSAADNVGKQSDHKYGVLRGVILPSITFLDGALTVSGDTYVQRYFHGAKNNREEVARQRDWRVYLYPHVSYQLTKNFAPYVAYFNDLEHYRNDAIRDGGGRWRKFNEKHLIEIGAEWQPIAGLNLNPYVEYGPKADPNGPGFVLKNSTVNLIAEYAFL